MYLVHGKLYMNRPHCKSVKRIDRESVKSQVLFERSEFSWLSSRPKGVALEVQARFFLWFRFFCITDKRNEQNTLQKLHSCTKYKAQCTKYKAQITKYNQLL